MGYEVEMKFRVADPSTLEARLTAIGSIAGPDVEHADLYFAHPARDFARTDEAFRIRRVGDDNHLTYKGPRQGGPTKTREEIEIAFAGGVDRSGEMETLLERLGFRPVARIVKSRRSFGIERGGRHLEVVVDRAGELGNFAEVETLAETEQLPDAQAAVLELAASLGLTEVEPRSYLRMTLERRADEAR